MTASVQTKVTTMRKTYIHYCIARLYRDSKEQYKPIVWLE